MNNRQGCARWFGDGRLLACVVMLAAATTGLLAMPAFAAGTQFVAKPTAVATDKQFKIAFALSAGGLSARIRITPRTASRWSPRPTSRWPVGAGFTEKAVYVSDNYNRRVVRADMTWQAEETCTIKD